MAEHGTPLTFAQWMAEFYPNINFGVDPDFDASYREQLGPEYDTYVATFNENQEQLEETESFVHENEDGLWVDPLTGTFHATQEQALQSFNAETQRLGFQGELDVLQEESQADIERVGAEESARARQLEAQRTGHALRLEQNRLRARGRSEGEIGQLTAGGIEGASRSLAGLLTDINLQTQRTQAQLGQQSIGTALTAEGLAGERSRQGLAKTQFQQSLEETRRQFGLGQTLTRDQMAQQQAQFDASLGFDQSSLAQAQNRFNAQMAEARRNEPKWWEPILEFGGQAAAAYGTYKLATLGGGGTCFDASTLISTQDGPIAISLLNGDKIKTPNGYRPVLAVHEYDQRSEMMINGVKVTKTHPFVMSDGNLDLAGNLKIGDMLWGGVEVTEAAPHEGTGKVYNLDVRGHAFYLAGGMLVHTGRDTDAI